MLTTNLFDVTDSKYFYHMKRWEIECCSLADSLLRVNTTKPEDDENEMRMLLPGTASDRFSSESEYDQMRRRWQRNENAAATLSVLWMFEINWQSLEDTYCKLGKLWVKKVCPLNSSPSKIPPKQFSKILVSSSRLHTNLQVLPSLVEIGTG